jgi:hypothetical protein
MKLSELRAGLDGITKRQISVAASNQTKFSFPNPCHNTDRAIQVPFVSLLRFNKLGNVRIAQQLWRIYQRMIFDHCELRHSRQLWSVYLAE